MSTNDGWRWSQAEYSEPLPRGGVQIASENTTGYLALSDDGATWTYYVPNAGGYLQQLLDEPAARAFAQVLPDDGALRFPTVVSARILRLWHRSTVSTEPHTLRDLRPLPPSVADDQV